MTKTPPPLNPKSILHTYAAIHSAALKVLGPHTEFYDGRVTEIFTSILHSYMTGVQNVVESLKERRAVGPTYERDVTDTMLMDANAYTLYVFHAILSVYIPNRMHPHITK